MLLLFGFSDLGGGGRGGGRGEREGREKEVGG